MTSNGTADQILSLPKGGGAVQGLGETFQPDFHTGTGSYAIPLDLPNGPNDIAPKLTLLYGTAAGNGPFGMGFGLNLLTIGRSTDRRVPAYTADDPLVLHGGGELVDAGGDRLRLRNETNAWRFHRDGDGFRITDTEGKIYRLGITAQARRFVDEGGTPKVLDWLLEEIADPLGNTVSYRYRRDGEQIYLERVAYGPYAVTFSYVPRPDPLVDGRAGFVITTGLRCTAVELSLAGAAQPLLRRWELTYGQSLPGGHSLLRQVKLTGFDEDGAQASLPTLTLGYSGFSPRRLERFRGESPEAMPGGGVGGRRELVDWDGDGLPDLIEIGAGRGRVWPNRGECIWGRPQSLGPLPAPVALDEPGVAFADMEGNGTADLLMLDRGLTGFYPHRPRGGFDRPVFWRQAPAARLTDPNARLVDLDADGIIDLLVTDDRFFELHYRAGDDGWRPRPVTVARPAAPPVSFHDPRIHLADMNGDGLQDLVRVDGAGVTYWPYLGNAAWAAPVEMANPPALPPRFDPDRLFLSDIDGDGCADLVYVDAERVLYWLNGGSTRLSDPVEVAYTPPAQTDEIRLADMRGSGTAGVLWTFAGPARRSTDFFYLDFMGGTKPYLLNRIDNGMGAVTEIAYGTSTGEAARDRRVGHAWHTFLPFAVPVVTEITMTDGPTGRRSESRFRYRDGHFDGVGREFCGFREVEIEEIGDAAAPTMQTRNRYHLGLDPADLTRGLTEAERIRLRTLRGKLLRAEVFGLDGAPEQDFPYTRTESEWRVEVVASAGAVEILAPRQVATTTTAFERRPTPFRVTTDRNLAFDADGNVTDREQVADDPRDPSLRRSLRTITTYAHDPTGRFRGKAARTTQRDGAGTVLSTTITHYDGQSEGQIGAQGLLTKLECLVLTDAMVAAVYGAAPPDFAALGYHRRPGEDGWWIDQVAYTRTDDAGGLRGTVANALGRTTQLSFDAQKLHPVRIVDPLGNVSTATFDPRANKLRTLTDANGATIANRYDPLGRLRMAIEPGATEALPTTRYDYQTATLPVAVSTATRAVNGRVATLNGRVFYDGLAQMLEERRSTGSGEIVERAQLYGSRGMVRTQFLPRAAAGPNYALPGDDLPHQSFRYDAIGRLVEVINPDGSTRRQVYEPGLALLFDEEDTRSGPGSPHADTPTRLAYDPTGRIMEVALDDGGTLLRTRYEYDVKGNLVAVTEADGRRSRFAFDLLGHHLRTESPASGVTAFVFDANGNPVRREDARGEVVDYLHDKLDRLRRVSFPATGEVASEFTYHDTGRPAPPGASAFTKGRVVRVAHQGGTEVYRYDALGRVTRKTVTGPGLPGAGARFDFTYRADGQRASVTYPAHAPGAPRVRVGYEYDARGLLRRIPGFVREIAYNAAGQRTRVRYDNGVVTAYGYDQLTMRVSDLVTRNGAGAVLQQFGHAFDLAGNLTAVASPDPRTTMTYGYDDLYRLTDAARGSGETWTYAYDGVGNISTKSDVGAFSYDVGGRLTAAGPDAFAYSAAGQAVTGPWGQTTYDAHGRLTTIVAGAEQTSCAYDHDGRRVRLRVTGAAAPHDILTPDDLLSIEDGVFLAAIYDGPARVAQLRLDTGAVAFHHGDHLGSTTLVTGPTGNVVQRVFYDPFGALLENEVAPGGDGTRYLYTGAEYDARSGLTYLHARYYHPKYGRFLTPDTLVPDLHQPQAWNRYAYVQNNPLRYVDPTGHFFEEIGDWFEDNWKYVVAAVAIVAIVVLTIVTFGAAGIIAVGIAMAIGGAIGGISAHAAGGDVLLGILVGMAVGGAAAFAGLGIGAGMAAVFGKGTLAATLLTGTLSGAVTGAAMGFTAGYAGGMGSADTIWDRMWKGALVGAITGLVLGGLSYWFQKSPFGPRLFSSTDEVKKGFAESAQGAAKSAGQAGSPAGAAGTLAMAPFSGSQNTGAYFLSPLLGGGSVLGGSVAAWQIAGIGLTSALSGAFVLDWADDLWKWVAGSGFAKFEKSGSM